MKSHSQESIRCNLFKVKAKTKTCRNCGWFKKDHGEVYENFYINCTNPEMKKGSACGTDSSEPFRFHKRRKFLGIV